MFARNERREERERVTGNWIFDEIPILRTSWPPFPSVMVCLSPLPPSTFISSLFLGLLFSFSSSSERKESRTLVWTKLESQSRVSCYGFKVKSVARPSSPFVIYTDKTGRSRTVAPAEIARIFQTRWLSRKDFVCSTIHDTVTSSWQIYTERYWNKNYFTLDRMLLHAIVQVVSLWKPSDTSATVNLISRDCTNDRSKNDILAKHAWSTLPVNPCTV